MAYPEKLLADDEKVVEHLHPHWIIMVIPTFWFLLICVGTGAAIAFKPDGTAGNVFLYAVLIIAVVLFCWLWLKAFLAWRTSHYVITTHRVLIRRGILHHSGRDIALSRISDVAFVRTLWDRMVNAGTLTIESAGEHGQETLLNVPHSDLVQQLINRLIEEDANRRAHPDPALGIGGYPPPAQYGGQYPAGPYPDQYQGGQAGQYPGQYQGGQGPGQYPAQQPGGQYSPGQYSPGQYGQPGQYPTQPGYPTQAGQSYRPQPGQYPPPGQSGPAPTTPYPDNQPPR